MTNKEILQIAMQQSAEDIGCNASDFLADDNRVVPFKLGEKSKNYYKLPIGCNFISYGNNVVAATTDEISGIAKEYVSKFKFYHCFETPNMRWLNERLEPLGMTACFMAEYYLPDLNILTELPCEYELRILEKGNDDMIRKATIEDISRIAEILVFVKRMNYRSIFNDDSVSLADILFIHV